MSNKLKAVFGCFQVAGGPFNIFEGESDNEKLEKFLNLGDDRNIAEVYIQV